jgi:hypothetical protein
MAQPGYFPAQGEVKLSQSQLLPGQTLTGALDFGGYIAFVSAPNFGPYDGTVQLTVYNTTAGTTDPTPQVCNGPGQFNVIQGIQPYLIYSFKNTGTVPFDLGIALATNNIGQSGGLGAADAA